MLTEREAREQALAAVRARPVGVRAGDELVIVDDDTLEREWGWVFFYTSRRWLETADTRYRVSGNGPLIVNRYDGSVKFNGTDRPGEYYVTQYDTEYRRNREGWSLVVREVPLDSRDALRSLHAELELRPSEVRELAERLPVVVMSGPRAQLAQVCKNLLANGIHAEVLRSDGSRS